MAAPINDLEDLKKIDALYENWRQKNPTGTYSQFTNQRVLASIRAGRPHTTLGPELTSGDWWEGGKSHYEMVLSIFRNFHKLGEEHFDLKVCDYGCGSLRVGAHFIKNHPAESFFGLDVTEELITYGREKLGDLIKSKKPVIGTIENKLDAVIKAEVDLLYTLNVSCHVRPEEVDEYYSNIKKITHKPKSLAVIHALVYERPIRFQRSGWAWPVKAYIDAMHPLKLVRKSIKPEPAVKGEYRLSVQNLTFQRM